MAKDITYTIQKGDSLSSIAKKFGLSSWKDIWNYQKNEGFRKSHPNPNLIYVGETIIIPNGNPKKPVIGSGKGSTIQINLIQVKSITFNNDHEKLYRNDTDWTKNGGEIKEPKWDLTHSDPVVFTMGSKIKCSVTFGVIGPSSLQVEGDIEGEGGWRFVRFKGHETFKPKEKKIDLEGHDVIPKEVFTHANCSIVWKVKAKKGDADAGTSGPHTFHSIMGTPIDENLPEDGLTTRRMETAVEWVGSCNTDVPVDLVEVLFKRFPVYTLGFEYLPKNLQDELDNDLAKKKELEEAGFATYMKDSVGGAWPLAQFERYGGECQAIVRLIRGILHQVGCPGKIELKYVNGTIDSSYKVKTQILDYGTKVTGPDSTKGYALIDGKVTVGQVCKNTDVGFNNYEACMKYTYPLSSKTMAAWFGGGAGKIGEVDTGNKKNVDSFEESLIGVFWGIVEFEWVYVGKKWLRKITWIKRFH